MPKVHNLYIFEDDKLIFNEEEIELEDLKIIVNDLKRSSDDERIRIVSDRSSSVGKLVKVLDLFNVADYKDYFIAVEKQKD